MRVRRACGGDACCNEKFAADQLGHVGGVLDGIIEVELFEAIEILALAEFVEIQRQSRAIIETTETSGSAFEMDRNIFVYFFAFAYGAANVFAVFALKRSEIGACDLNLYVRYRAV